MLSKSDYTRNKTKKTLTLSFLLLFIYFLFLQVIVKNRGNKRDPNFLSDQGTTLTTKTHAVVYTHKCCKQNHMVSYIERGMTWLSILYSLFTITLR